MKAPLFGMDRVFPGRDDVVVGGRDGTLDVCRGLAALSVVWIHTVFWSGTAYVPDLLRTLALMVDVPLFMFLSGSSAAYAKKASAPLAGALRVWVQWAVFCALTDVAAWAMGDAAATPAAWLQQALLVGFPVRVFPVLWGSTWFLPMYVRVCALGSLLLCLTGDGEEGRTTRLLVAGLCLVALARLSYRPEEAGELIPVRRTCMYLCLWIAGHETCDRRVGGRTCLCAIALSVIAWWACSRAYGIPARDLQAAKFPEHVMYLAASVPSLAAALWLRGGVGESLARRLPWLGHIGRNALMFYFSQGVGSSFIYSVVSVTSGLPWQPRVALAFVVNLAVTASLGCAAIKVRQRVAALH